MKILFALIAGSSLIAPPLAALAKGKPIKVTMNMISATGVGESIGTIMIKQTDEGLELHPKLKGLPPGEHGFHLHENPSCEPGLKDGQPAAGIAAGGHYDPAATKAHKGPGADGHKGDLPKMTVNDKGMVKEKLAVPGLTFEDIMGRALMIHAGGDNYSDTPQPLGGGGGRIACGVINAADAK